MALRTKRRPRGRRPWSLRTRLVVSAVALIAVVGAAIGTVTTFALRSYLVTELDDQLKASVRMAVRAPGAKPARENSAGFVMAPGSPLDAAGIRLDPAGTVLATARNVRAEGWSVDQPPPLTEAQGNALAEAARKSAKGTPGPVDAELPGLGSYRVLISHEEASRSPSRWATSTPPCAPWSGWSCASPWPG